jgi:hypothetical protein
MIRNQQNPLLVKGWLNADRINCDEIVKNRHSRAGGNLGCSHQVKTLDSRFHGNDEKEVRRLITFLLIVIMIELFKTTSFIIQGCISLEKA